jgi:hypothetical protein
VAAVLVPAALLEAALNTVAPTAPPASIEPPTRAATTFLRMGRMRSSFRW